MKTINLILLLVLAGITSVFAQSRPGVSPYIFPEFVKGSVLQKGGGVTDGMLDFNTLTQELLFLQNGEKIVLDNGNVDTVFIQNKKFVPVGTTFYQKLTDTKIALYQQHINKLLLRGKNPDLEYQANNNMSAGQGYRSSSTKSSKYELWFGDGYTLEPHSIFWLQKGKSFSKVSDLKSVLKVFPAGKEASVNAYINDNKLDISKPEDLAKLVVFCNLQ